MSSGIIIDPAPHSHSYKWSIRAEVTDANGNIVAVSWSSTNWIDAAPSNDDREGIRQIVKGAFREMSFLFDA